MDGYVDRGVYHDGNPGVDRGVDRKADGSVDLGMGPSMDLNVVVV